MYKAAGVPPADRPLLAPDKLPKKWANLPLTRGLYKLAEPLDVYTTFGIGGPAEVFFEPADVADLATFYRGKPQDIELTLLGEGSNILVRDGGIPGVVVHLGAGCDNVAALQDHSAATATTTIVRAEAGAGTGKVARFARDLGLTGVEFICGVPGSMGGALVMNAGCYGRELADVLEAVEVVTAAGEHKTLPPAFFEFAYRHSTLPAGWVYVAAIMRLEAGDKTAIRDNMREVNRRRAESQPLALPNAGSLFKNPPGHSAWQLIERAGCRGLRRGDAQVSEKHCNFFVNLGQATAADMEALAEDVRARVKAHSGIDLVWEVRRLGTHKPLF